MNQLQRLVATKNESAAFLAGVLCLPCRHQVRAKGGVHGMSDRKSRNVTLKDVAARVGVSAMTVSRALAGKTHLVSPETAERCKQVAAELGYMPNLMARSLRGEQLKTIVLFAEHISSHHYLAELVDLAARTIEGRKYSVISCQSLRSFHETLRNFRLPGAVIIAPPEEFYADPFGERGIGSVRAPSTVLLHSAVEQNDFNEVSPDIASFNYQAACHLLELGHKHLAYLGGPRIEDEPTWFGLRRQGILKALGEFRLTEDNLAYQSCSAAEMGPAALQQLLGHAPQTTAVMCINDEIAIACIAGAQKLGLTVPRDLSVVGSNNISLARFFTPSITTLAIDIPTLVTSAIDMLFDDMISTKPHAEPIKIKLPANLIVRDSSAPPGRKNA